MTLVVLFWYVRGTLQMRPDSFESRPITFVARFRRNKAFNMEVYEISLTWRSMGDFEEFV